MFVLLRAERDRDDETDVAGQILASNRTPHPTEPQGFLNGGGTIQTFRNLILGLHP